MPQFSIRFLLEATFVISAGLAGATAVYSGEANQWPGFNVGEGYLGTHFLRSTLYSIGDDVLALRIVSTIWFVYGALMAAFIVLVIRHRSAT